MSFSQFDFCCSFFFGCCCFLHSETSWITALRVALARSGICVTMMHDEPFFFWATKKKCSSKFSVPTYGSYLNTRSGRVHFSTKWVFHDAVNLIQFETIKVWMSPVNRMNTQFHGHCVDIFQKISAPPGNGIHFPGTICCSTDFDSLYLTSK